MRSFVVLSLWLLGILFPLAWLGRFSTTYQRTFDTVFRAEWMHVLMHLILYVGLGMLLYIALRLKFNRRTFILMSLIILCVGILQEGMQFLSQGFTLPHTTIISRGLFDLSVDLIGGLLGLVVMGKLRTSPR
jgi:VanZ family protein